MFAVAGATEDLGGAEQRVLRAEHTVYVRARLEEQVVFDSRTGEHRPWSPTYRNKHLTALRQVIKIAWQLGRVTAEECDRAVGVRPFEGVRLPAEEQLTPAGVDALLDACDADLDAPAPDEAWYAEMRLIALRDAAMIDVLHSTGLRQAELARLALDDYYPARRSLRVRGKSDKKRLVLVTRSAAARVEAWLAERGRDTGGLVAPFTPRSQRIRRRVGGRIDHPAGQTVSHVITERSERAKTARLTARDFRRTFISELLIAGVDLSTAQALAGCASLLRGPSSNEEIFNEVASDLAVIPS